MTRLLSGLLVFIALSVAHADGVRSSCPRKNADDYYFPAGAFGGKYDGSDAFERKWYTSMLAAMKEPSLSCGDATAAYRFVWIRTFSEPIAFRVTRSGKNFALTAVETDGEGGYAPGRVKRRETRVLTMSDVQPLLDAMDAADFWNVPTELVPADVGLDGSQWIVEATDGARYHVAERWTPTKGPVHDIGMAFITLSGWTFVPAAMY